MIWEHDFIRRIDVIVGGVKQFYLFIWYHEKRDKTLDKVRFFVEVTVNQMEGTVKRTWYSQGACQIVGV